MGYVYHANYISYCHVARTEMLRKIKLEDALIESKGIMMPVIDFTIKYKIPAHYDELLFIKTWICEIPKVKMTFHFEIKNEQNKAIAMGNTSIAFVKVHDRKPIRVPQFVIEKIQSNSLADLQP